MNKKIILMFCMIFLVSTVFAYDYIITENKAVGKTQVLYESNNQTYDYWFDGFAVKCANEVCSKIQYNLWIDSEMENYLDDLENSIAQENQEKIKEDIDLQVKSEITSEELTDDGWLFQIVRKIWELLFSQEDRINILEQELCNMNRTDFCKTQSINYFCDNSREFMDCPFGISGGIGTRCYKDELHTGWWYCSDGWALQ